jgi:hypothetical protein
MYCLLSRLCLHQCYSSYCCFNTQIIFVRSEVFTAVTMKNAIFWYVTPCGACKKHWFLQEPHISKDAPYSLTLKVKIKVILWPMISWPVCPGIRPPSGTCDQFFFQCHGKYCWTFAVFFYVVPSLTRGRVCNISVQSLARNVTLGSKSLRNRGYILLSHLRLSSLFVASYS